MITHTSCRAAGRCHRNMAVCQQNWQYRAAERERERDAETSRERWSEEDTSGDCRMERRDKKILMYRKTREEAQRQCYKGKIAQE